MYNVIDKIELSQGVYRLEIDAPAVAAKVQPGQFIMLMVDEKGERIPVSLVGWDRGAGTIAIVVSRVGCTTSKLTGLEKGDALAHLAGPLGKPAEIGLFGNVACVVIGYGMASIIPVARALTEAGNQVYSIVGAATASDLFATEKLKAASCRLTVATSDGSRGEQGWVIEPLRRLLDEMEIKRVMIVGSLCMMKNVSEFTQGFGVKTMVSLNPIMVDGTGMCGACRCSVDGKTRFACVDGPEFDGHQVDWNLQMTRRCTYPALQDETASTYRCQYCGQW